MIALGLTKYNLAGVAPDLGAPEGREVILVPGQVEDDASIRLGAGEVRTNAGLLRAARDAAPRGLDRLQAASRVLAGLRTGAGAPEGLAGLADVVLADADTGRAAAHGGPGGSP